MTLAAQREALPGRHPLANPDLAHAMQTSIEVAVVCTAIATLLGPLASRSRKSARAAFETAMDALEGVLAGERVAALTVSELNPRHGAADGSTLRTFVERLAAALDAAAR